MSLKFLTVALPFLAGAWIGWKYPIHKYIEAKRKTARLQRVNEELQLKLRVVEEIDRTIPLFFR